MLLCHGEGSVITVLAFIFLGEIGNIYEFGMLLCLGMGALRSEFFLTAFLWSWKYVGVWYAALCMGEVLDVTLFMINLQSCTST